MTAVPRQEGRTVRNSLCSLLLKKNKEDILSSSRKHIQSRLKILWNIYSYTYIVKGNHPDKKLKSENYRGNKYCLKANLQTKPVDYLSQRQLFHFTGFLNSTN